MRADIEDRLVDLKQFDELRKKREEVTRNMQLAEQAVVSSRNALIAAAGMLLQIVQKGEAAIVKGSGIAAGSFPELVKANSGDVKLASDQAEALISAFAALKQALLDVETKVIRRKRADESDRRERFAFLQKAPRCGDQGRDDLPVVFWYGAHCFINSPRAMRHRLFLAAHGQRCLVLAI